MRLPSAKELAFFTTVGVLAAFGVVDWPIAGVIIVGHVLATSSRSEVVREVGEGLAEA